ncbi:MAG: hypothetical protein J6Y29_01635 [Clostridiales bacterium]|nr:hypothetical protein [Clostridiales bacterium]
MQREKISKELIEKVENIKIGDKKDKILLDACREGNVEVAQKMIKKGADCKVLFGLNGTQMGAIYNDVIREYLNESISKMDSSINRLYDIPTKDSDKEISKVSSELNKVMEVLNDLKEIDKVHKYDGYGNELVQQRIRLMEATRYTKERGRGRSM